MEDLMATQGGLGDETKDPTHDEQPENSNATGFGMAGTSAETVGKTDDATPGETDVATSGETDAATPGETDAVTPGDTHGEAAGETRADEQIGAADNAVNGSVGL
jgi:hypothetical protein